MSNTNTGGPAFPVPGLHENNDYDVADQMLKAREA
jgi:hypothetical protein